MTTEPGRDARRPAPEATTAALAARKAQILADLQRTMARRRAARLAARAAGAAAITSALAIPAALGLASLHRRTPAPAALFSNASTPAQRPLTSTSSFFTDATTPSSASSRSTRHIEIITDPPDILTRCVVTGDPPNIPLLSDDDLLAALAEAGRPAGLIRVRGQALLVSHSPSATAPAASPADDGSPGPQGV
jgi:hypothetical protein